MKKIFSKDFFKFLLGFLGVLFFSGAVLVGIGFYEVEIKGNSIEAKAPAKIDR